MSELTTRLVTLEVAVMAAYREAEQLARSELARADLGDGAEALRNAASELYAVHERLHAAAGLARWADFMHERRVQLVDGQEVHEHCPRCTAGEWRTRDEFGQHVEGDRSGGLWHQYREQPALDQEDA